MRSIVALALACSSSASLAIAQSTQTAVASAHAPHATLPSRIGDVRVTTRIDTVMIVVAVGDSPATLKPVHAKQGDAVTLYALVHAGDRYYSDAAQVMIDGKKLHVEPMSSAPAIELAWSRIEPATANMSNTASGTFHFEAIDYRVTAIDAANRTSITADVRPTLTTDHGDGVGTMRYQLAVTQGDRTIASPGIDSRRGRGSGGLTDSVTRVSIRRDDTFLGYMTEMYGQPYVWASAGLSDKTHQSERLEGSDCADLMVYGARRMGKHVAYTWTGGLAQVTKLLASGTRGEDGIYRDRAGKPMPFTHVGDLVLFPRHVGALAEDKGTLGVLDDQDIVMHTLFDSPKEQRIADTGYAGTPIELRQFK